ncbi:MAG: acyl-CoA dehydrogenase family protein [Anaerolineae bacterium]|nr:acyl-CoA dehydrogenase family protein [Anaerolineae bacterium]
MKLELTPQQKQQKETFRVFVDQEISPYADQYEQEERVPPETIKKLADQGYLGALIPEENGGLGLEMITYGLLCEEVGRGSASLLSLLTVQGMVAQAILKWGSSAQKTYWLPKLAAGEIIGAFGLTEPDVGSDAKNVQSTATVSTDGYRLNGRKKWISFGQIADVFLIIAQCDGQPAAFLVERRRVGFSTHPITGMLGFRAAMLAEVHLQDCYVPAENLVGRVGFGFSHVAGTALDYGRYCVGWGCVGLAQACLEACLDYTRKRKQFGTYLKEHQLIQQMIAEMIANIRAARLLCYQAGYLKAIGDPNSIMETSIAKYFASKMAYQAAGDAVQIHGANGCSSEYPVQRYLRDAKIMEIIEGSTQMQQMLIASYGYQHIF